MILCVFKCFVSDLISIVLFTTEMSFDDNSK